MLILLSWFVVIVIIALWSLTAWAAHAFATWVISGAGGVKGAERMFEGLSLPAWIPADVLQAISSMLWSLAPAVEWLLGTVPMLQSVLTLAVWVVWGIGGLALVLLGAGLHVLLVLMRRRDGGFGPTSGPRPPVHQAG